MSSSKDPKNFLRHIACGGAVEIFAESLDNRPPNPTARLRHEKHQSTSAAVPLSPCAQRAKKTLQSTSQSGQKRPSVPCVRVATTNPSCAHFRRRDRCSPEDENTPTRLTSVWRFKSKKFMAYLVDQSVN